MKTCIIKNCNKNHYAKGMCSTHWQRSRNGVDFDLPFIVRNPAQGCGIENCNESYYARGYCSNHYMVANYQEKKLQLVSHFDEVCIDCEEEFPPYVFDFDCVVEDTSTHVPIGVLLREFSTWERLAEEISVCEMVCANCHRERTYERKYAVL